jgi:hypothetical protein
MPNTLPLDRHGFIRSRDARALGRQGELRAAVARGELESVRRGVYRIPAFPPTADVGGRKHPVEARLVRLGVPRVRRPAVLM